MATQEYYHLKDAYLGAGNFDHDANMHVMFSVKANKALCSKENCISLLQTLYEDMQKQICALYDDDKPVAAVTSQKD